MSSTFLHLFTKLISPLCLLAGSLHKTLWPYIAEHNPAFKATLEARNQELARQAKAVKPPTPKQRALETQSPATKTLDPEAQLVAERNALHAINQYNYLQRMITKKTGVDQVLLKSESSRHVDQIAQDKNLWPYIAEYQPDLLKTVQTRAETLTRKRELEQERGLEREL